MAQPYMRRTKRSVKQNLGVFGSCGTGMDSAWWNGGPTLHILPRPAGVVSILARDLSDNDLIVGIAGFSIPEIGVQEMGFVYSIASGQYTFIEPLEPQGHSVVNGINDVGAMICGWRSPSASFNSRQAYVQTLSTGDIVDFGLIDGLSTFLADINDQGTAIGAIGVGIKLLLWQNRQVSLIQTPPDSETYPRAINSKNQVVGQSALPTPQYPGYAPRAFHWQSGVLTDLGTLLGDNLSSASDVNSSGLAVGLSRYLTMKRPQIDHGVVWHDGVIRDLTELVDPVVLASVNGAGAVSEEGVIVGRGVLRTGENAALLLTPRTLAGDATLDCAVNMDDLLTVINSWGPCEDCDADFDEDGLINISDLFVVIEHWTFAP